jgi:hypothetical protein
MGGDWILLAARDPPDGREGTLPGPWSGPVSRRVHPAADVPSRLARPLSPLDLLRVPRLGTFLRWRHARTTLQVCALALAVAILLDGFFGPQLAPRNLAGVIPWVHWRGSWSSPSWWWGTSSAWPAPSCSHAGSPSASSRRVELARLLRSKWLAVGSSCVFFWAYEAYSLWASPWLTAWVAGAYFLGAFVGGRLLQGGGLLPVRVPHRAVPLRERDGLSLRGSGPGCGGVRALHHEGLHPGALRRRGGGAGERVPGGGDRAHLGGDPGWATGAPSAPDPARGPAGARGNGRRRGPGTGGRVPSSGQARGRAGLLQRGCELALYLPEKEGNLDCTFCMECIQACPHDNVGILARSPLRDMAGGVRSGVGRIQAAPGPGGPGPPPGLRGLPERLRHGGARLPAPGVGGRTSASVAGPGFSSPCSSGWGSVLVPLLLTGARPGRAAPGRPPTPGGPGKPLRLGARPPGIRDVDGPLPLPPPHRGPHGGAGGAAVPGDLGLPAGEPGWGLGAVVPESWLFPLELVFLQGGLLLTLAGHLAHRRGDRGRRRGAAPCGPSSPGPSWPPPLRGPGSGSSFNPWKCGAPSWLPGL